MMTISQENITILHGGAFFMNCMKQIVQKCTNEIVLFRHYFAKIVTNCHEIVLVFLVLLNEQLLIRLGGELNMRTENKHTYSHTS